MAPLSTSASTRLRSAPIAAAVAVLVGLSLLTTMVMRDEQRPGATPAQRDAVAAAREFLDRWVDPDGRVVRRDQGNDTVSEGQSYGMLLAVAAGDRSRFDEMWNWTRANLQRPDGLLSFHWQNGRVADSQAAADADLDATWALTAAAARFHDSEYRDNARTLAAAVLAHETVATATGRLLVAGPWASGATAGGNATVNPSYSVGGEAGWLTGLTGDRRWSGLDVSTRQMDDTLLATGSLPPDWATEHDGVVTPSAAPGGGGPQYGLDATRLVVRLAASCSTADRQLAARAQQIGALGQPAIRALDGHPTVTWQHPISDIATAAVAAANHNPSAVEAALAAASHLLATSPTYYGAAWVALGRVLLTTNLLSTCPHGAS